MKIIVSILFCATVTMGCGKLSNIIPPDPQDLQSPPDKSRNGRETVLADTQDSLDYVETTEDLETHVDVLDTLEILDTLDIPETSDVPDLLDTFDDDDQLAETEILDTLDLLETTETDDVGTEDVGTDTSDDLSTGSDLFSDTKEVAPEVEVIPEVTPEIINPCDNPALYWDENLEKCLLYPCCEIGNAEQPVVWDFLFVNTVGFPWQTYLYEAKIMQDQAYVEVALLALDGNAPILPSPLIGTIQGDNMVLEGGQKDEIGILYILISDLFNDMADGDLNGSYTLKKSGSLMQIGTCEFLLP